MASKAFLIALAIVATIVAPTLATEYIVGDFNGWKLNFDYQNWAAGKQFFVGDTLVFNYPVGVHNVIKANGTEFQSCTVALAATPFTSGHDVITLATPGKKWYICGVGNHCQVGPMKLAVTVWQAGSEAPAPNPVPATTPQSGANGINAPALMITALVSFFIMFVA